MRHFIITITILLTFLGLLLFFSTTNFLSKDSTPPQKEASINNQDITEESANSTLKEEIIPVADSITSNTFQEKTKFAPPLDRANERITKKKFGQFITPQNSPVQPEKFFGYHTGTDFEIFPEELNTEVSVYAVCNGKVREKRYATGYGGLLIQNCELDSGPVTIVYGHLKLASINKVPGETLGVGELIGILGTNKSTETSGERKHLHLGVHKGTAINVLGYVQTEENLSGWANPCLYFCK